MKRNLRTLTEKEYDLVIVGGGIFGICAAWDAALRGLTVALVERGDFCHATSASHFKIVHGGIRYLQHADLYRIRESSRERNALLRIAPHLVRPLPIVIPTYGHGLQGKEIMATALLLYNLIVFDRNRGLRDPLRRIPPGRLVSRRECLQMFPGLQQKGLTGGVLFFDGQMYNPPRLGISYLRSAAKAGAATGNYLEVTDFLTNRGRVFGVRVRDVLTGNRLDIRGKVVINAAGPWAEHLLRRVLSVQLTPKLSYSRDACFVVARNLTKDYALAMQSTTKDPDAILSRGNRHLFIAPWREKYTLFGVWHQVYKREPDELTVSEEDLQGFLDEINAAYPSFGLTLQDISMWNAGLVLFGDNKLEATDLSYGKRSLIIDHAKVHNVEGLITLIGVRATTSRGVAQKAVDLVFNKLARTVPSPAITPIYGGEIESIDDFLKHANNGLPSYLSAEAMKALVQNYGSAYKEVLKYVDEEPALGETVGQSKVIKAEIVHAVREEMAQKLADVVFRRTDLGTAEYPGGSAVQTCANLMVREMGWDNSRVEKEIAEVKALFPKHVLHTVNRRMQQNECRGMVASRA